MAESHDSSLSPWLQEPNQKTTAWLAVITTNTGSLLQWHRQMRTGLSSLLGSGFCCWVRTEERRYFHDVSSHRSRGRAKCQARFAQLLSTVCCCTPAGSCRFWGKFKGLGWDDAWSETEQVFLYSFSEQNIPKATSSHPRRILTEEWCQTGLGSFVDFGYHTIFSFQSFCMLLNSRLWPWEWLFSTTEFSSNVLNALFAVFYFMKFVQLKSLFIYVQLKSPFFFFAVFWICLPHWFLLLIHIEWQFITLCNKVSKILLSPYFFWYFVS